MESGATDYMTPADAAFVTGDCLTGFHMVLANKIAYGVRLIAPLSRRVTVVSKKRGRFSGTMFDVYTEHLPIDGPFKMGAKYSGPAAFQARMFSGTAMLRVNSKFHYEEVPVEEIRKNDVVVSMSGIVAAPGAARHKVLGSSGDAWCLLTRVSHAISRHVHDHAAVRLSLDSAVGLVMDGVAVRRKA